METKQISETEIYRSPIRSIFEKFSRTKDASLVYGDPIELVGKQVLPVAKVNYYVGGGGGFAETSETESASQGEGGGGHFSVKPVGVFEITPEKVTFKPIINIHFLLTIISVVILGLGFLLKRPRKIK
ncbi:spore germination protein GerW family protein [Bacillus sp. FJAT-22090]|uniref:spore germination protein GerW family protein n=1 Tax=Bacillus sp. FJAT-22090 TaxID=1581038 RepID=UPI0011A63B5B|nr:spore germination protein GerW family protein [Bacillus sp. FJAT-22090]